MVRDNYYEQKLALINGEVSQRAEWHSICMAIKREELAIKKKQVLFWDAALSALQSNTVKFGLIVCFYFFNYFLFRFSDAV